MRRAFSWQLLVGLVVMTSSAFAQIQDVQITASKKKLDEQKEREGGNKTVTTKEIIYNVSVQNKTFKPMEDVQVKYMIFLTDSKGGSKASGVESSHTGSETMKFLGAQATFSFDTKSIKITQEDLDAGWYYTTGAGNRARDKVNGVWVRAYVGGKMVGEYANPSTIKKNTWKE